jgi:hypothetical protein
MLDNGMRRGVAKIARQLNIGEATSIAAEVPWCVFRMLKRERILNRWPSTRLREQRSGLARYVLSCRMTADDTTACSTRIKLSMSFTAETIHFIFNKLLNTLLMNLKSIFRLQTSDTQRYRGIEGPIVLLPQD